MRAVFYIRICKSKIGRNWDYRGRMEKNMETTIVPWVVGFSVDNGESNREVHGE